MIGLGVALVSLIVVVLLARQVRAWEERVSRQARAQSKLAHRVERAARARWGDRWVPVLRLPEDDDDRMKAGE